MKALEIKKYSASRYLNMRACDQKYYSFTADWGHPQTKAVVNAALKSMRKKLDCIKAAPAWGTKDDTAELVDGIIALMVGTKLTDDPQENAFIAYQLERYTFRAWYRGTKEQRDAAKASLAPKAEAKAETKTKAKAKVEVKAKTPTKKAAPKSAPETKDGKVIVHEVEVEDKAVAEAITWLGSFLQDELTDTQKRSFVTGLVAALK